MTTYALSKLIREVNRTPQTRSRFQSEPESLASEYELSAEERAALLSRNIGALYKMGVHGLILRPFTIILQISEPDYLAAIRS